mmetsp:Transcript_8753/g.24981  ORF Transcript_8753/g.24981 Transcript_8753/m.24981 type:complete len:209 (-) Transcript_8753:1852-2478(-)
MPHSSQVQARASLAVLNDVQGSIRWRGRGNGLHLRKHAVFVVQRLCRLKAASDGLAHPSSAAGKRPQLSCRDVVQGRQRVGRNDNFGSSLQELPGQGQHTQNNVSSAIVYKNDCSPIPLVADRVLQHLLSEGIKAVNFPRSRFQVAARLLVYVKNRAVLIQLHAGLASPIEDVSGQHALDQRKEPGRFIHRIQLCEEIGQHFQGGLVL